MAIIKLNKSQICSVKKCINTYNNLYEYRDEKKIFSFVMRKGGYYERTIFRGDVFVTIKEIERDERLVCRDERVYYKPHLEIKMSNGVMYEKFFETEKELNEFMESDTMKGVNFINI